MSLSYRSQFCDRNPLNGKVHRYEERIHFSRSKRLKLREVEKKFLDNQIGNMLDSLGIRDLEDKE